MKRVTLVEINVYENMVPLVSGYLQAYASADPDLRDSYRYSKYTTTRLTPFADIEKTLSEQRSDVYAFSCYLWNIGLVKPLVAALQESNPDAHILLGGPQVMHHGAEFLSPGNGNLLVCNGEGEKTFANLLRELSEAQPNFANVRGLSFYTDGTLVTTENETRIRSLDEVPSPYLMGLFDGQYDMGVIETNRGCPFHCGFCFWGAATNDKVVKFSDDRILDDISWISRNNIPFLYIADANWGMLKRDVDISNHIVKCKEDYGLPVFVYFSAAKNSHKRVTQVTEIFTKANVLSAQPISIQSLSDRSLELVERKNIKLSAYEDLQTDLNEKNISSFIELIWPLPGETLASFKDGIEKLCEKKAAHIVTYPHLLLHNTPIYEQRDQYRFESRMVQDGAAEAEIVVQTADVTHEDFKNGMRFIYCILALYNTRSLSALSDYLHATRVMSYADLYSSFVEFSLNFADNPFVQFRERSIADADYYDILNYPAVYHMIGHADRDAFDNLLYQFASSQSWWQDENARVLFELDILAKPFIYSNTPVRHPSIPIENVALCDASNRRYKIEIPQRHLPLLRRSIGNGSTVEKPKGSTIFELNHDRGQRPYHPRQSHQHNANYCNGVIMRVESVLPIWKSV